jgi:hypothetical protein
MLLTVPALFRVTFYHNAARLLRGLMRWGAPGRDDVSRAVRGKALQGGAIVVLHTHGRHGQYHPPLHLLATSGGDDDQRERWDHGQDVPSALLRRKWQWHRRRMVRQRLPTEASKALVETCFTTYPNGRVTNVHKGHVPAQSQSVARDVAKSGVSPPLSGRRIDRSAGERVTYPYRSHRTDRVERETVEVATGIGRMIQPTMPKGFKGMRSYGVQATKTFAQGQGIIHAALAKVVGVVTGAVKIIARLTSRQRYEQRTGRDPFRCPHCPREMGLWRIWHPTSGGGEDEGQKIKRGTYTSSAQRAGP